MRPRRPPAPRLAAPLLAALLLADPAGPAAAAEPGTVVAARPVRAGMLVGAGDVAVDPRTAPPPGGLADPALAIGREARVLLQAGRPILADQLAAPALVQRNGTVTLRFRTAGLEILAEGRALARAGTGETVRVMNLASRLVVTGRVAGPGLVEVGP